MDRKRLLAAMILMICTPCLAQTERDAANKGLDDLKHGRPANLQPQEFKNKSDAATAIARRIPEFRGNLTIHQAGLVTRSYDLECRAMYEAKKLRSSNGELMGVYVELLSRDDICTGVLKGLLAKALREFYTPKELDRHAATIREALNLGKERGGLMNPDVLLLYGLLPSNRSEDVLAFVRALPPVERIPALASYCSSVDSVLARHGDKKAEERLLAEIAGLHETCGSLNESIKNSLSYADTARIREYVSRGLRSEKIIPCVGGGTVLERSICAATLVRMMRDDETFPVKEWGKGLDYSDTDLDAIEKWCAEHWGSAFPKGSRKALRSEWRLFHE